MSDEQPKRRTIVAFIGSAKEGNAWLQAAWVDSQIEITVSEEKGADSSSLLSQDQARNLAHMLLRAIGHLPRSLFPACQKCGQVATWHMTDIDPKTGKTINIHFCEEHGRQHCDEASGPRNLTS
jgi:hypothetical protein